MSPVEHAVELGFDRTASATVEALMARLDAAGITSLGATSSHVHPHVSLSVAERGTPDELAATLDGLGGDAVRSLPPLSLSFVGAFLAPARVVFLGVTATEGLVGLHRLVDERLEHGGVATRTLYRRDAWVPHCTLAMHVEDLGLAFSVLDDATLPITATPTGLGIVEVPTGKLRATVS